jgi:Icc-related predicted phosphoesterase
MASGADVVIGAGDFASMRLGVERTLNEFDGVDKPVLLVPGNNESASALSRAAAALPDATVLHGDGVTIDGVEFFGLGGGVPPTPFPWSWDLSEADAAAKLADCPEGAVLIVHSPPRGYVDEAFGRHLGSRAVRAAIEAKRPPLALCGHIHQCWGQEGTIGDTRVVNLGPRGHFFQL